MARLIADEVPGLGEALFIREGDYVGVGLGFIPGGKLLQKGFKRLKSMFKSGDELTFDPGLGNKFKDKTVDEVNEAMQKHVDSGKLEERYTDPVSGSKSYQNIESGFSYNVDTGKSGKTDKKVESAHIDVNYPKPKPKNKPKKKLPIKNQ